jgi:Large extracellular alpha-helical protein
MCETLSGEVESESVNVLTKVKSIDFSFNWENPKNRNVFSPFGNIYYLDKDYTKSIVVNTCNNSNLPLQVKGKLKFFKYSADELFNTDATDSTYSFVREYDFESGKDVKLSEDLPCGIYKLIALAPDSKGRENTGEKIVIVYSLKEKQMPGNIAYWMVVDGVKCKYREESNIFLGSSLKDCYVLKGVAFSNDKVEYDYKINIISNEVVKFSNTFIEEYGDKYQFSFVFIKDNEVYDKACVIERVKEEYSIIFKRESFRDKLLPGAKEKWKFTLFNNNEKVKNGQVVANMYDESLDKIKELYWHFYPAPYSYFNYRGWYNNLNNTDVYIANGYSVYMDNEYLGILKDISHNNNFNEDYVAMPYGHIPRKRIMMNTTKSMDSANMVKMKAGIIDDMAIEEEAIQDNREIKGEDIKDVTIRTNLNETAFFYPNLLTNEDGSISIEFTTPESLTRWKLMMLAHTPDMKFGMHTESIVTEKDFMVMPNIPRFCRQDDKVGYSVLIINKKAEQQSGDAVIELFNPYNDEVLHKEKVAFNVNGNSSTSVTFLADTPQNIDILGIRIIAGNREFSDGEQKVIPVLPSKTLVTESMIMNIRGKENKTYNFSNYLNNNSKTLENYRYSVQFTGNPAWYVVQALPALSEFKFPCASDATSSYYVTSLATHIAKSDIGIKKAIELWKAEGKDGETLVSNLEKNEELKQILLAESPWVMEAKNESENMQALSQLFNVNRQDNIKKTAIDMLVSLQNPDGGIAWFKGMKSSVFQTINSLGNFARLRKLGVEINDDRVVELEKKAVRYTDKVMVKWYKESLKYNKKFIPFYTQLLWVNCRSFYKNISMEKEVEKVYREVKEYYGRLKKIDLYEAALLSLALRRDGENAKADKVNELILKRMSKSDEMGYYWANNRSGYWHSAVQIHVALMAALYEGGADEKTMNELKLWLLRQKQTQIWEDTPTTVEAIYGILLIRDNWLESKNAPIIKVGGEELATSPYIAFAKATYMGEKMNKEIGTITIEQKENHPGFGAAYWQYFENFNAIKQNGKELKVTKSLFRQISEGDKTYIEPLKNHTINQGDIIVIRLVIKADRDFEFVSLKDQRAACFNPVDQLSTYKWNENLWYYLETKDATTNYFFEFLPKGTYVLEYKVKTTAVGNYNSGISSIQCMYAPEFVGNTQGEKVVVLK